MQEVREQLFTPVTGASHGCGGVNAFIPTHLCDCKYPPPLVNVRYGRIGPWHLGFSRLDLSLFIQVSILKLVSLPPLTLEENLQSTYVATSNNHWRRLRG